MARFLWAVTLLLIVAGAGYTQLSVPATPPQPAPTARQDTAHRGADSPEPAQKSKSTPAASPQPAATARQDAAHRGADSPEPAQKSKSTAALHPENTRHSAEPQQPQSAEQQQKFLENLHRWQALSPEEREVLRQRQRLNEKKREESIAEAYQKSGLHLNEEQRQQFRKRYLQERSKLEEQLLKEIQEARQAGNTAIVERLKKEFASNSSGAGPSTGSPATASH